MILKENCIEAGYIQKPHGIRGEVILIYFEGIGETLENLEYVFIEISGGLVPFFYEPDGLRIRNDESAICKFDNVNSQEEAREIIGCKVFVAEEDFTENESEDIDSVLIGMNVIDNQYGDLGLISRVDDYSGNLVITVNHRKGEVLIPLSKEIIISFDENSRQIHLNCPKGLIEIYLE